MQLKDLGQTAIRKLYKRATINEDIVDKTGDLLDKIQRFGNVNCHSQE